MAWKLCNSCNVTYPEDADDTCWRCGNPVVIWEGKIRLRKAKSQETGSGSSCEDSTDYYSALGDMFGLGL